MLLLFGKNKGGIQLELTLGTSRLLKSVDYEMIPSKFGFSVSTEAHEREINHVLTWRLDGRMSIKEQMCKFW